MALAFASIVLWQAVARPSPGNPDPHYPAAARRLLIAGDVTFRARVSVEGRVEDVLVLTVPAPALGFEEAMREAVVDWRFEPIAAPTYYLGRHSFSLRPNDEAQIRALASSMREERFHDSAAVILGGRVHRKTGGPWLTDEELASLEGRVRGIDFAAGDAAEVALDEGGVLRMLKVEDAWQIVFWEPYPVEVERPEKIADVLPFFPLDAREARREHLVVLQALIDHEGGVRYVDVVTSVSELDEPAMAAARQWRFRPARREGVAIPFVMTLTVGFAGEAP